MVSCSFVQLCCVITPCFFLFGASSHPYIPLHFEEMTFPLVQYPIGNTGTAQRGTTPLLLEEGNTFLASEASGSDYSLIS